MIGAIIGDIVGSRFEGRGNIQKDFEFFTEHNKFTDDTVLTCAIARAILNSNDDFSNLKNNAILCMQELGNKYINCGYGYMFYNWLRQKNPQPYNSFGNGSAMRVSAIGYVAKTLKEVKTLSKIVTEVTHNHQEGIKGAEATSVAIFMALNGKTKQQIKDYIEKNYYIIPKNEQDVSSTCLEPTCQKTLPKCFYAFFNSNSFEDAIRKAVSLGGDTDTLGAITGSIAESFYGVPEEMKEKALSYLDDDLLKIVADFMKKHEKKHSKTNIL